MQFYSLCFSVWFASSVRIYDDFNEYIHDFAELSEAIAGGAIDTYKFRAFNEETAYEKAKRYYKDNGWKLE